MIDLIRQYTCCCCILSQRETEILLTKRVYSFFQHVLFHQRSPYSRSRGCSTGRDGGGSVGIRKTRSHPRHYGRSVPIEVPRRAHRCIRKRDVERSVPRSSPGIEGTENRPRDASR